MKVLSLFSGIGAFEKALDNIGINYELVNYCEFDKYASKSYCAVHGVDESLNLGDVTKVDEKKLPKDIDMITYGFPCQDISVAGKGKGFFDENGNTTRSGLFFDALRIIEETQPKYAIAENVKNLTSKKFATEFEIVLDALDEAGYNNYWKVLNSKDFGIPQNRERVFIVSIRKDIDTGFEFPEGFPLEKKLKDLLEDEVDEKYYLGEKGTNGIIKAMTDGRQHQPNILSNNSELCPTIDTKVGAQTHRSPYIVKEGTKKGYAEAYEGDSINLSFPSSATRRGRVGNQVSQTLDTTCNIGVVEAVNPMPDGSCRTLKEQYYKTSKANFGRTSTFGATGVTDGLRIRKLIPKECWRLQGFDDESFERAAKVNSNTQLYKQAENSITVTVLEYLFKQLFKEVI